MLSWTYNNVVLKDRDWPTISGLLPIPGLNALVLDDSGTLLKKRQHTHQHHWENLLVGSSPSHIAQGPESVLVNVCKCGRNFSQVFCLGFGGKKDFVASQGCDQQNYCFPFISVLLF